MAPETRQRQQQQQQPPGQNPYRSTLHRMVESGHRKKSNWKHLLRRLESNSTPAGGGEPPLPFRSPLQGNLVPTPALARELVTREGPRNDETPLCIAVRRAPSSVVAALAHLSPESVRVPDSERRLPIHRACLRPTGGSANGPGADSETILRILLSSYPESAVMRDDHGRTPLHYLFLKHGESRGVRTVELLSGSVKEALWKVARSEEEKWEFRDRSPTRGSRRRRRASDGGSGHDEEIELTFDDDDENEVSTRVESMPQLPPIPRPDGRSAPHSATVVPDNNHGALPLHYAVMGGAAKEAIRVLIKSFPGGVNFGDRYGRTPLAWYLGAGEDPELELNSPLDRKRVGFTEDFVARREPTNVGGEPYEDDYLEVHRDYRSCALVMMLNNPVVASRVDNTELRRSPLHWAVRTLALNLYHNQKSDDGDDPLLQANKENFQSAGEEVEEEEPPTPKTKSRKKLDDEDASTAPPTAATPAASSPAEWEGCLSMRALRAIVDAHRPALAKPDGKGLTPLHVLFHVVYRTHEREWHALKNGENIAADHRRLGGLGAEAFCPPLGLLHLLLKKAADRSGGAFDGRAKSGSRRKKRGGDRRRRLPKSSQKGTTSENAAPSGGGDREIQLLSSGDQGDSKASDDDDDEADDDTEASEDDGLHASREEDDLGRLPLHYALLVASPPPVLQALIKSHPASVVHVTEEESHSRTPLHMALSSPYTAPLHSASTIRLLLSKSPSARVPIDGAVALKMEDATGRYPLHLAAEHNASLEVTTLILEGYPRAAKCKNENGDLPVHLLLDETKLFMNLLAAEDHDDGQAPKVVELTALDDALRKTRVRELAKLQRGPITGAVFGDGKGWTSDEEQKVRLRDRAALRTKVASMIRPLVNDADCLGQACSRHGMLPLHIAIAFNAASYGTYHEMLRCHPPSARARTRGPGSYAPIDLHAIRKSIHGEVSEEEGPKWNAVRELLFSYGPLVGGTTYRWDEEFLERCVRIVRDEAGGFGSVHGRGDDLGTGKDADNWGVDFDAHEEEGESSPDAIGPAGFPSPTSDQTDKDEDRYALVDATPSPQEFKGKKILKNSTYDADDEVNSGTFSAEGLTFTDEESGDDDDGSDSGSGSSSSSYEEETVGSSEFDDDDDDEGMRRSEIDSVSEGSSYEDDRTTSGGSELMSGEETRTFGTGTFATDTFDTGTFDEDGTTTLGTTTLGTGTFDESTYVSEGRALSTCDTNVTEASEGSGPLARSDARPAVDIANLDETLRLNNNKLGRLKVEVGGASPTSEPSARPSEAREMTSRGGSSSSSDDLRQAATPSSESKSTTPVAGAAKAKAEEQRESTIFHLSDVATRLWTFFTLHSLPADPADHYAHQTECILDELPFSKVEQLVDMPLPSHATAQLGGNVVKGLTVRDCANVYCKAVIHSAYYFVGLYDFNYPTGGGMGGLSNLGEDVGRGILIYRSGAGGGARSVLVRAREHRFTTEEAEAKPEEEEEKAREEEVEVTATDAAPGLSKARTTFRVTSRDVCIKFMQDQDAYEREVRFRSVVGPVSVRQGLHAIVPLLSDYDATKNERKGDRRYAADSNAERFRRLNLYGPADGSDGEDDDNENDGASSSGRIIKLSEFPYAIVMPLSTVGDLHDQFCHEGLDAEGIRDVCGQIARALHFVHIKGVAHCKLSMRNIIALQGNQPSRTGRNWTLTDLTSAQQINKLLNDAQQPRRSSCYLGGVNWNGVSSIASCCMPPEMFVKLEAGELDSYEAYWREVQTMHKMNFLSGILEPYVDPQTKETYVLKCHFTPKESGEEQELPSLPPLPYNLVQASPIIDLWSFGVIVFGICSGGRSLFPTNYRTGQLLAYDQVASWDRQAAEQNIYEFVDDPLAQDLLLKILVTEEQRLGLNMTTVLSHPFLNKPGSQSKMDEILTAVVVKRIADSEERKGALDELARAQEEQKWVEDRTSEVRVLDVDARMRMLHSSSELIQLVHNATDTSPVFPYCFIVLPYKLVWNKSGKLTPSTKKDVERAERLGKQILTLSKVAVFVGAVKKVLWEDTADQPSSLVDRWAEICLAQPEKVTMELLSATRLPPEHFVDLVASLVTTIEGDVGEFQSNALSVVSRLLQDNLKSLLSSFEEAKNAYLYLIDEYNCVPILKDVDDLYPHVVTENLYEVVSRSLPFMQMCALHARGAAGGVSGLVKLIFEAAHPHIPPSWAAASKGLMHKLDRASMINEIQTLNEAIKALDESSKISSAPSGQDSNDRELQFVKSYFDQFDSEKDLASLRRMADAGASMWTTPETIQRLRDASDISSVAAAYHSERANRKKLAEKDAKIAELEKALQQLSTARARSGRDSPNVSTIGRRSPMVESPKTGLESPRMVGRESPKVFSRESPRTAFRDSPNIGRPSPRKVGDTPVIIGDDT